ncbi:dynein axonemal intermediate chain 7 [Tenrec ecaudatus]|uniref:dynein axonemal intermediate chain 7 n=1 Tax=Tenrec ecaudatus TaxID=94439 RepID=UPI003F5A9544
MSARKKNKITKAERLKMLQEEEERRLREEEEARLKHEKEEMERLETKRIEKEKWQALEAKDLERRNEELEELQYLEECYLEAEKLKQENRLLSQWKHYIKCDGSPDPSIPQEMNTFISLWKEETSETFEEVIQKSKLVLNLIEKLKLILLETPLYDLQDKDVKQHEGSIEELKELLHAKFNVATGLLLRQASTLADLDSGNMEKIIQDENVTLYVWANLKKNPRYKSIKFSGTQVGFEIPRMLATCDIALRLLHTHYDHVTPLCSSLRPLHAERLASAVADITTDQDQGSIEETTIKEDQEELKQPEGGSLAVIEEGKLEEEGDAERIKSFVVEDSEATKFEVEMKLLSKKVLAAQLLLVENTCEKPKFFEEHEIDLLQFTSLGGVYHLDILELPPQCKPVNGWMMVEILKEGLQKYKYPPEISEDLEVENIFPPIVVTIKVQENVLFFEDPIVARWDPEGKHWRTDGIDCVVYNSESRLVTFNLATLSPVTLVQDTHINMPYQSWELRPLDVNKVLLTVTTLFTEIHMHIKENLCMLASVRLKNKKHFSILNGQWMAPVPFMSALKEAGLNIFPTMYSHFYVVINNKIPMVELKAYRQMALLSSAFAFRWSQWNLKCDSNKVVFQVKELLNAECDPESSKWALFMFNGDRAQRLKIEESSETYSEALMDETELHSTLYHMVKDSASGEAIEKIRKSNCQFTDSVCQMLLSTRLLSYS